MATGAQQVFFQQKRILGLEDFNDRFMEYLKAKTEELFALTYNVGGVFTNQITFSASGPDQFDLDTGIPSTDGNGHVLTLDANLGENIQFENTLGITYYVGLRHSMRPVGVQINPRTGFPEFQISEETIGDSAAPDSIVNLGSNLEMIVDSVTEVGVNNTGRQVLVYKNVPGHNATSEAVAIETATVTWDGVNNKIQTAALFGQVGTPSTTASDYTVILLGPTVKRNTDLSLTLGNAFIGTVLGTGAGNPPAVFDVSGQNRIDTTLTGLDDITRVGTNLDLKISVDAHPADVNENQIEVLDAPGGSVVFSVDEAGNVRVEGNLIVVGTETVQNVETVNTNQIIGNNLIAGDNDADSHTIQGTFTHVSTGFGGTTFQIDGTTGDITFNSALKLSGTPGHAILSGAEFDIESGGAFRVLAGGLIDILNGGDMIVRAFGDVTVEQDGEIHINDLGLISLAQNAFISIASGTTTGNIAGHLMPTSSWDLGEDAHRWNELFLNGRIDIERGAFDGPAIDFLESNAINFSFWTLWAGTGSNNALALWTQDSDPNYAMVMNRLGETAWGSAVTGYADIDTDTQMTIFAQSGHKAAKAVMNGDIGFWASLDNADISSVPVASNLGLLVDNNSVTVGAASSIRLDVDDEGGYILAKRIADSVPALAFGLRLNVSQAVPAMWIEAFDGLGAAKVGIGSILSPTVDWNNDALLHIWATALNRTDAAFLDNSILVEAVNANSHAGIGFRNTVGFAAFLLDGADPDTAERRNLSLYVGATDADNRRWWSFDIPGTAALDRNDSAGLMTYAGRDFTTPSGGAERQAEQLVGLNQNKSIVCRGHIDGLGGTPTLGTLNNQYLNVASVTDLGTGHYQISFVTQLNSNYTVLATVDNNASGNDTFCNVANKTTTSFQIWIFDGTTATDADVDFVIIGKPNTTPSL